MADVKKCPIRRVVAPWKKVRAIAVLAAKRPREPQS